jgi:DNA polymerase III subunit gamma/tau
MTGSSISPLAWDGFIMATKGYQVLARKWRPQAFSEVVAQDHITRTLQNAIRAGRIGHAYLFIGSRGIGKTTTARILAKALNCRSADSPTPDPCGTCENCVAIAEGRHMDVIEIDGASNNKVEDVREIRDQVRLTPSSARYKIYIIDEVHQLSSAAFNALLKTLEEPPEHAIFVLATTEAHKVPATIVSRCQRFDFRRVGQEDIVTLLRQILDQERIQYEDEALYAIARAADGGVRDSESILDQLISYCHDRITFQDVFDVLGLVDWQILHNLCDAIADRDIGMMLTLVDDVVVNGKDLGQFVQEILRYFRNLLVCKTAEAKKLLALPEDELLALDTRAKRFGFTQLIRLVEQFAALTNDFDSQVAQRVALETLLIRHAKVSVELSVDGILEKLVVLEQQRAGHHSGQPASVGAAAAAGPTAELEIVEAPPPPPASASAPAPAPRPAEGKPVRVTGKNLQRFWSKLTDVVQRDHSVLGVWLAQGQAERVEGDRLTVRFPAGHKAARDHVEQPDNRAAIERLLRELTANVTGFHTEFDATPEEAPESAELPFGGSVTPDEARAALAEPHIAQVVDVFKGRIVQVKRDAGGRD